MICSTQASLESKALLERCLRSPRCLFVRVAAEGRGSVAFWVVADREVELGRDRFSPASGKSGAGPREGRT